MMMALIMAGVMNLVSYWFSDKIVLKMYGAKEVTEAEAPRLYWESLPGVPELPDEKVNKTSDIYMKAFHLFAKF